MRRYYIVLTLLLLSLLMVGTCFDQVWALDSDQKTLLINHDLQVSVEKASQKRELIIPQDPLDFASQLTWEVNISKKVLSSDKYPASFTIEELGTNKQLERKMISGSGKLMIPKGKQYKIILDAGEYSAFLTKSGATVKANISFAEAQVKYSLGDKPFRVDFEIAGPSGFGEWKWLWGGEDTTSGTTVSHQFKSDGKTIIMLEGKGKTPSGLTSQKYSFEFETPPLVALTAKVDPLKGSTELAVTATANAVVNYGQKATYTWNFGNGIEISGPEARNTYLKPGRYLVNLSAMVDDYKVEKTYLVEVSPETILSNSTVTPILGAVPLKVAGTVNPKINGGPAQLEYTWEVGGKEVKGTNFEYTFTEPGDYRLMIKAVDKLHLNLVIPEEIILIKALPPQINLKPIISIAQGTIPLTVNFDAGLTLAGGPVELVYRWEFGDGEVSSQEKPSHIYKKPGDYSVHLVIMDRLHAGNLVDTIIKVTAMPPQLKASMTSNTSSGLAPLTVNFLGQVSITGSPCEPQYIWDFGDGTNSNEQNPVHTFNQPGEYEVVFTVKDRFNPTVTDKLTTQIEVQMPKIRLAAVVTPTSGVAPLTVNCQATVTKEGTDNPKVKCVWEFGDGSTVQGMIQSHTYEKPGIYNIVVYAQDEILGITERKTLKVTVK